ncbi:MAG: hypothetical protein AAGB31_03450 [Bdellovibrio sp.]
MRSGILLCALIFLTEGLHAQESRSQIKVSPSEQAAVTQESTLKMGEVLPNKKFEDDKEITDAKLRAEAGSLSRYSMKFSLSYAGPPIGDLSNKKQPNPDGSIGVYDTSLGGAISGRYRLDGRSTVSLGTGITALTPFHGTERVDVKNPFLSYDLSSRLNELQMRNSVKGSVTTVPNYIDVGQYGSLGYDTSLIYNFGASGFATGVEAEFDYYLYNRDYEKADGSASRYKIGLYPQIKYNFSDKVSAYTSVAFSFVNPRARSNEYDMLNKMISGRLGAGYAFSRDIYVSSYLNYYPENLRTESTTLSLSTVFSLL